MADTEARLHRLKEENRRLRKTLEESNHYRNFLRTKEEIAVLREQLDAANLEIMRLRVQVPEDVWVEATNDGAAATAKALLRIATEGRESGVFGGEIVEAAVQAILKLREERAVATARAQRFRDALAYLAAKADRYVLGIGWPPIKVQVADALEMTVTELETMLGEQP